MENNKSLEDRSAAIHELRENLARPYKFDQTGKFIAYWFSLPKKGLMPEKSSIDPRVPRKLKTPSESTWLIEFAGKQGMGVSRGGPSTDVSPILG